MKGLVEYFINKGWQFSGERTDEEKFLMIKQCFLDIKHSISYSKADGLLVVTRNSQLVLQIDVSSKNPSEWEVIYPKGWLKFELKQIPLIKEWIKTARKI